MHHGSARLLLRAPDADGRARVLLWAPARRLGGAPGWDLPHGQPSGSRPAADSPEECAMRLAEQAGLERDRVRIRGRLDRACPGAGGADAGAGAGGGPGGAPAVTVVADTRGPVPGPPAGPGRAPAWVPEDEVSALPQAPVLAAGWPALRAPEALLVVDGANVVGSRPDGWWRDRVGAAERLIAQLATAAPGVLGVPPDRYFWVRTPVVVVEGQARGAVEVPGVEVLRAPGSGDDTIVEAARRSPRVVVVTADRGLRARLPATAHPLGPGALRAWLGRA